MQKFGLLGKKLEHSYSKLFFDKLFLDQNINASFEMIEIDAISQFENIKKSGFSGLSVTLPYKESIIPYLDELDETASAVAAVNCIKFNNGKAIGYNTDVVGFGLSLSKILLDRNDIDKALVLGSGGAAKAVLHVLNQIKINSTVVSRNPKGLQIGYTDLDKKIIEEHKLIINCSPLGMYPNSVSYPEIPYKELNNNHIIFDLVYNPSETVFMKKAKENGAKVFNGLEMLQMQALAAWEIWNA
jgi:shikimate dehydrogenase